MTRSVRRALALACTAAVCLTTISSGAHSLSVVELLESYRSGRFTEAVTTLEVDIDVKDLLKQRQDQGPSWIDAGGAAERDRRELVAATFALEAERADEWREWKFLWKQPEMCAPAETKGGCVQPLNVLEWKAPPLLIEWACRRMRK